MTNRRDVVILGSTGSIGTQALDVVRANPDSFNVIGLAAGGGNVELLAEQIEEFSPDRVAIARAGGVQALIDAGLNSAERDPSEWIVEGADAITELAGYPCDVVLNAVTGSAGLLPTLRTLETGTTLALANKESLVIGGRLVTEAAAPGQIVAVDSEHSAIAQALRSGKRDEVSRIVLTASGGPFRTYDEEQLASVTIDQTMAHPTWNMGQVITVNSATLVNKGLELLEAALLYDVDLDDITVVVHPSSVVHSMVEFVDGSTIAQASPPDMRLPIALGLGWPDRVAGAAPTIDWTQSQDWHFEPLRSDVFPAVELARICGKAGGTAPAVYNAANEECVASFVTGEIGYLGIVNTVAAVVEEHLSLPPAEGGLVTNDDLTLDAVLAADRWGREAARNHLARSVS